MKPGNKGFTLIEFLIALSLSAVVLSAIYSLLYTSLKTWKRMQAQSELYQAGRIILERIEQDIDNTIPLGLLPIQGDKSFLSFPTLMSMGDAPASLVIARVQYQWDKDESGGTLVRNWEMLSRYNAVKTDTGKEKFPSVVSEISFSFASKSDKSSFSQWKDKWSKEDGIPQEISVYLKLKSEDSLETLNLKKYIPILQSGSNETSSQT